MTGVTYDELRAMAERIERYAGWRPDMVTLERIVNGPPVRERRHGVTPGGMPWSG